MHMNGPGTGGSAGPEAILLSLGDFQGAARSETFPPPGQVETPEEHRIALSFLSFLHHNGAMPEQR